MAANLTVTAAKVAPVFTKFGKAEIYDYVASTTITAGMAVAIVAASGLLVPADASTGGGALIQFKGVALTGGGAGQAISVLEHGCVYGFDLSGMNYGSKVYLSNDVGLLCDHSGSDTPVECGEVRPLPDANITKVLFVDVNVGDVAHST